MVQGVALELLCRLFAYRGFESLSFRIFIKNEGNPRTKTLVILIRFKSDENNIRQLAIH